MACGSVNSPALLRAVSHQIRRGTMAPLLTSRRRIRRFARLLPVVFLAVSLPYRAIAQGFSVTITVDENGHGLLTNTDGVIATLPFALQQDVGPGGLANALTYSLINPPGLTAGDVLLLEFAGGPISDVLRFNPNQTCATNVGCLVFYSDLSDGPDA